MKQFQNMCNICANRVKSGTRVHTQKAMIKKVFGELVAEMQPVTESEPEYFCTARNRSLNNIMARTCGTFKPEEKQVPELETL